MKRCLWGFAVLLFCCILGGTWAAEEEGPIVKAIEIRFVGPETVNRAIVKANIQTTVGKPRSRDMIEQDVRTLIGTGFFLDVRVLEEPLGDGVRVVYQVTGKATIKQIDVEGGKQLKNDRLKREVGLKVGDILDERKVHESALKMIDLYQKDGFPDVKVDPITSIDRDTGKAILKFKVYEGDRVFIKAVDFTGNIAVPTAMLRKIIKTKRRWWGSFLAGSGVLKDDQFQEDLEKIRDYYRSKGYIDMEIKGWHVERVAKLWIVVHIDIFEGHLYKVGTITIEGNKLFTIANLMKKVKMTTGRTFTPDDFQKDVKALEDYYGSRGYLDTHVNSRRDPNVETGRLDITYSITEGELVYIEMINIRGNTKTKDKVIRRELAVAPGDVYNTVRIDASKERLKNLGYFSKVEATPEPTGVPNRRDLSIQVEEQRTGNVTFGAGFSSVDSLIGFVELTQSDFDLFNWPNFTGAGQKLRIRAQLGFKRQDYTLSFVEPWFLDQRLLLGVDIYRTANSYLSTEYNETRTGSNIRLERAINDFLRAEVQYSIQDIREVVNKNASLELQTQRGSDLRSAILVELIHDARDSVFLTTRGERTELSAEVAGGPLGGDVSIYKLSAKSSVFFSFFDKQVLEILGNARAVGAFGDTLGSGKIVDEDPTPFLHLVKVDDVPIFDRFFLGGPNTLRGFGYNQVSPKDVNGQPVGGNTSYNATAEYSVPIIERVRWATFFDVGEVRKDTFSITVDDIKADAGMGVRLNLPIGPLRLDYGYPILTDHSSGRTGKIQFSVGYQF